MNNYSAVPKEMLEARQWVPWKLTQKPGAPKPTKVPRQAKNPQAGADTTNPAHCGSIQEALAAKDRANLAGVGFVFTGTPYFGVDLDNALDDKGHLHPWAEEIVQRFEACAFIEWSPSGTGLHLIGRGGLSLEAWHKVRPLGADDSGIVEVYDTGRFFTVTGRTFFDFSGLEIGDAQDALDWLQAKYAKPKAKSEPERPKPEPKESDPETEDLEDQVVIDRAKLAANGAKFDALMRGDLSGHGDDHSAADLALCSILAFWTRDAAQIDRIFRASALMRPKWDERRGRDTYGAITIQKALEQAQEHYGSSERPTPDQGGEPRPRLRALRRDDLLATPDVEWIIKGVMPARGVGVVYGPSTVGKSFVEVDKAAHLAEGRDWFGFRTKKRPVVYACLEGQHGFKRRVLAWEAYHGRRYPSEVVFAPDPIDLRSEQDTAALIELVKAEAGPGAVVIIDTLNRAAPGMEENSSVDYGRILANAGKIEQAVEGFVCFVGHPGKNKEAGLRGHSSMFAGLDMVLEVEEVGRAELSFAWITRKVKDGQDGIKRHFRREVVELFEDADGDLVTSCVIVPDPEADQEGKERPKAMTSREADSLTAFKQAAMEHGEVDADGRFSSLQLEDWRAHFYQASTATTTGSKRSAFHKAKNALIKGGWLSEDVYGNLSLIGPGADVHAEVIAAAILEKSNAYPSVPMRTQGVPGTHAEAKKRTVPYPVPLRTGTGTHGPGGGFEEKEKTGPFQYETPSPPVNYPTGTTGEGWEDIE